MDATSLEIPYEKHSSIQFSIIPLIEPELWDILSSDGKEEECSFSCFAAPQLIVSLSSEN